MPDQNLTPEQASFCEEQFLEEQRLGWFSHPFGSPGDPLLLGMSHVPTHTVSKPHTDKLHLVVDHSAGEFSLNSLIDHADVYVCPDNIHDLGHNHLVACRHCGDASLWLFKSDVSQAYRRLPMHPLWQIKQVVSHNGLRRVDRCNNFGGRASGKLWCTFMSLVLWIAVNIKSIPALLAYIDDNFSHDEDPTLRLYPPYSSFLPAKQVRLLQL
jgi:hypothetical protein